MGSLTLSLSNPQVVWRVGEDRSAAHPWELAWRVRFADGWNSVQLSSGGDLRAMPATLTLRVGKMDADPEREEDKERMFFERLGQPIGLITYVPAYGPSSDGVFKGSPDSYEAAMLITEDELQEMVATVLADQGPRQVRLNVPQFKYGNAPDGSSQTWDVSEQRWIKFDGATFIFGALRCEIEEEERRERERQSDDPPPSPPPSQPSPPSPEAQALTALSRQIGQATPWLFGLLAAIFVALVFGR